jgi:hypothetical protein
VTIRLIIAPTSGNGAGAALRSDEESLGAFEAVPPPHPQNDAHKRINGAIFLACIYLSETLYGFPGAEFDVAVNLFQRQFTCVTQVRLRGHGFILLCSGLALEYRNPRRTLNAPVSVTPSKKTPARISHSGGAWYDSHPLNRTSFKGGV